MLNLSVLLEDSARRYPEKSAFTFNGNEYSYTTINAAANQVASALKNMRINPGEKIALSCFNLPVFSYYLFWYIESRGSSSSFKCTAQRK